MRILIATLSVLVLSAAHAEELTMCGRPAPNAYAAVMAMQAFLFDCEGVREISVSDLGRLTRADGVDLDNPSCERDVAMKILGLKAKYHEAPARWCAIAREFVAQHPLTKHLVGPSARPLPYPTEECNEIDKVAALIDAAVTICGFKETDAGNVVRPYAKGGEACRERHMRVFRDEITLSTEILKGNRKRATAAWCRSLYRTHAEQSKSAGMKVFFAP